MGDVRQWALGTVRSARRAWEIRAAAAGGGARADRSVCDRAPVAAAGDGGDGAAGRARGDAAQMGAGLYAIPSHAGRAGGSDGSGADLSPQAASLRRADLSWHRLLPRRVEYGAWLA